MSKREKTPTVIQMEAVECGAAALGIILGYFGKFIPLAQLRMDCGVSRDGSNAANIIKAARNYGLEAKGYRYELEDLKTLKTPFIIFWHFNHFIVVEGFAKQKVFINDPASGPRTISWEEFDRGFTGVAILFEKSEEFRKGGEKESLWSALKPRFRGCKTALFYLAAVGLLLLVPGIVLPGFSQLFVDMIFLKKLSSPSGIFILAMALSTIAAGLLTALQGYFLTRLNAKLSIRLSSQFLWHILRLPVEFYAQRYGGEIASRIQANDLVVTSLTGQIIRSFINLIMVIFYGLLILYYDLLIGAIAIMLALFNLFCMLYIARSRQDARAHLTQIQGKQVSVSIGALQNIETIKATAAEGSLFAEWAGHFSKAENTVQNVAKMDFFLAAVPPLTQMLGAGVVLTIGGARVIDGSLSYGMLFGLQILMGLFLLPITQFVYLGQNLQNIKSDLSRLDDVLKNPVDRQLTLFRAKNHSEKLRGELEMRNLTFGYSKLAPPLIENFNLHLYPGKSVALVGPSGCGKSTMGRLILGLYQPWEGEILYDGRPTTSWTREVFNRAVAGVDQEIFLFRGTIRDNLTLWDETLPEEDLYRAAADAQIHDEILMRHNGYDSEVHDAGHNFSGGQRQRLEIARVLATNPSLLILDEATSALDTETEEGVIKKIRERGCATLVIAHRLSTIRDCDEIIILDKGKVIQRGSHDELKTQEGIYLELIKKEGVLSQ